MKYCINCGTQIQDELSFCPNCGTKVGVQGNNQNQQNNVNMQTDYQNHNQSGHPFVENKNIGVAILLSIVTCGIYGIIWFIKMVDDVNKVCNDENSNQSGGTVFLLTLVTCGIYGIIWFYQAGKRMFTAGQKYSIQISDNSTIYLVLMIFGLGIVNYCLIQSDLNRFSRQ